MSVRVGIVVIAAVLGLGVVPASASPIVADGTWYEFGFEGVGSFGYPCASCTAAVNPVALIPGDAPWEFSGPATITVLDLFSFGDQFELFDGAASLGISSAPGLPVPCGPDITCALADLAYSRLVVDVGAGAHSLTIKVTSALSASGGAAVFRAVSTREVVPEPASLLLLGAGISGIALNMRRRRQPNV